MAAAAAAAIAAPGTWIIAVAPLAPALIALALAFGLKEWALPSESSRVTSTADPRLLARYDADAGQWRITEGTHRVVVGNAADEPVHTGETQLTGRLSGR